MLNDECGMNKSPRPEARSQKPEARIQAFFWLLASHHSAFIIQHSAFPCSHFPLIFACYSSGGDDEDERGEDAEDELWEGPSRPSHSFSNVPFPIEFF
jgi:hypothetical protein